MVEVVDLEGGDFRSLQHNRSRPYERCGRSRSWPLWVSLGGYLLRQVPLELGQEHEVVLFRLSIAREDQFLAGVLAHSYR